MSEPLRDAVGFDAAAELRAAIPRLRAFAISLSGRSSMADDLVQETLVRAWAMTSDHVGRPDRSRRIG